MSGVLDQVLDGFSTSSGQRLRPIRVCWRTRGGRPIRLGDRPGRIPTETSRRIKASFTRVIDPTLQRINFTTLLGRRHPPGPHRRAGPHTGLSLAEEPESRSNSYLARSFSVFLLRSAILAHFFYVDSRYRTWSDLARNDALAGSRKECRGEEGPRGLSEDTDGVIDQRRKKDSELFSSRSSRDSSWISSPRPGHHFYFNSLALETNFVKESLNIFRVNTGGLSRYGFEFDVMSISEFMQPTIRSRKFIIT
ncbi:hypothetical protein GEV33_007968 [Tenebrio molitor]|uniref:Uncharacterized protein n=1 Tax=Tenebrio molitor TaxID=7067 RepID=A0A8J6LCM0_TENMO|nr:hypothetical protein GEV33_007968 [Tenebrio molitor]